MIRVGVLGSRGRMGSEVCRAVTAAEDHAIVADVDEGDALDVLTHCDVLIDFTTRASSWTTCAGASSTGWTPWRHVRFRRGTAG